MIERSEQAALSSAPRSRHFYVAYVVAKLIVGCVLVSTVANIYQPGWEYGCGIVGGWLMGAAMKEMFPAAGTTSPVQTDTVAGQ